MGDLMTSTEWHVGRELWQRYVGHTLDYATESAVEAHVDRCAECRLAARAYADPAPLDLAWSAIAAETARPQHPVLIRGLIRLGLPERDAVLIGGSSGLYRPWVVAVMGSVVCAILTGFLPHYQDRFYVLLAPLVPALAVAASYDVTDRLRDLLSTTPHSKLRLALLRTSAALASAVPLTVAVGVLVPGLEDLAFASLLPGLCLTVTMLVLLTWWDAATTTGVVAAAWAAAIGLAGRDAPALVESAEMQVFFLVAALGAASTLVVRTATSRANGGF
jgi:hypothetical protein